MRDDGRADMNDPCMASRQLTKSLARFAKKHLQVYLKKVARKIWASLDSKN